MADVMSVSPGDAAYPRALSHTLGGDAPQHLAHLGNPDLLKSPLLAVFCSVKCPASLILGAHDVAQEMRRNGTATIGGFHAPVEKEMLTVLLGGEQPVVIVVARGLEGMRVKREHRKALEEGRLLFVSPFSGKYKRATAEAALYRNRVVAALGNAALFVHASAGGKTQELAKEVRSWGKSCLALRHILGQPAIDEEGAILRPTWARGLGAE